MNKFHINCFALCLIITSCNSCNNEKLSFDLYGKDLPETLTAYNDLKTGLNQRQKQGVPAMYIDFSAGMNTAFGQPVIRESMSQCFNTILNEKLEVYKLVNEQVTLFKVNNSTELGQIITNKEKYLDRRAPIQVAVEKIVAANNDALLITDFEEWQNNAEVTNTAYLKIPFSKWLNAGNSISFFIADYREGKVDKHIYFTVFTYGRPSGNSLIDKLSPKLSALPARFHLATDAYLFSTSYTGAKAGGLFRDASGKDEKTQNVLDLQAGYLNGLEQHKAFEYYPLGVNWATIAGLRKDYEPQNQFNDLLRKLQIDLSDNDSYTYGDLEVKTYDVTADFERFAKWLEVKKHKPVITKGNDAEDQISDKETDPFALACYNPNGSVKLEYRYEKQDTQLLNDVFMLNKTLFNNTLKADQKKAEIGIAFSPQFDAAKITNPSGLIKVALHIRQSSVNSSNPSLEKLRWLNKNGISNSGLYESVRSTLDELKPTDKEIYAYYIKTTEQ